MLHHPRFQWDCQDKINDLENLKYPAKDHITFVSPLPIHLNVKVGHARYLYSFDNKKSLYNNYCTTKSLLPGYLTLPSMY